MAGWNRTGCALLTCSILGVTLTVIGGCGVGYYRESQNMAASYEAGDLESARAVVERVKSNCADRDKLVWQLEYGTVLRTMGDFHASEDAFDRADLTVETYDWQPEFSITEQAGATLTNLAALRYLGYGYDRIMLSTYRALNMMKLGDLENARVELNRAYNRQREAIELNRRRIETAEEEAAAARERGYIADDQEMPSELHELGELDIRFADLYQAQGEYVNPFTEFLHGLYFLYAGTSAGDLENGRHAFERLAAIAEEYNSYVREELERAEDIIVGRPAPPVTYVIFETGRAPSRDQIRIDIPVPIGGIDYVGAAFPRLVFHDNYEPYLIVEQGAEMHQTELLSDMDTVIGLEFQNELPQVITRTIFNAAAQAAAHYAMHEATRGDDLANLFVRVGSVAYRAAQAQADRRTWCTLPKQFQYCRITTPENRTITLYTPTGPSETVAIEPGHVNVVYVRSIAIGQPLRVWQFHLK